MGAAAPAAAADEYYLGAERIMGLYWQRQSATIEQGSVSQETSQRTTSVGVLALDGATPASVPRVGFDVFVSGPISIGGSFIYTTTNQKVVFSADGNASDQEDDLGSHSMFALTPRAGYQFAFDDRFGFWPHAGFMYARDHTTTVESVDPRAERDTTLSTLSLTLDGMFYATPFNHFIVLGGPFFDVGLWGSYSEEVTGGISTDGDARLTAFGLAFGLGATF